MLEDARIEVGEGGLVGDEDGEAVGIARLPPAPRVLGIERPA